MGKEIGTNSPAQVVISASKLSQGPSTSRSKWVSNGRGAVRSRHGRGGGCIGDPIGAAIGPPSWSDGGETRSASDWSQDKTGHRGARLWCLSELDTNSDTLYPRFHQFRRHCFSDNHQSNVGLPVTARHSKTLWFDVRVSSLQNKHMHYSYFHVTLNWG